MPTSRTRSWARPSALRCRAICPGAPDTDRWERHTGSSQRCSQCSYGTFYLKKYWLDAVIRGWCGDAYVVHAEHTCRRDKWLHGGRLQGFRSRNLLHNPMALPPRNYFGAPSWWLLLSVSWPRRTGSLCPSWDCTPLWQRSTVHHPCNSH